MPSREIKIYCPKCSWEPVQSSRWICSCNHRWNTFDTAGVCPRCSKAWEDTACLSCERWSRHAHWYHDFIDGVPQEDAEPILEPEKIA